MKLSDDELLSKIEQEEKQALGYMSGDLSQERSDNMSYYLGEKFGDISAVDGRSSVVSNDVLEAVEAVLPSLMRTFASGEELVRFSPVGPEDVEAAEQESMFVNWVAQEQNNGYLVLYNWFKDALINKVGYVKYYWDESEQVSEEFYQGLTDEELTLLLESDVEPVAHTSYMDEDAAQDLQEQLQNAQQAAMAGDQQAAQALVQLQQQTPPMLHDVRVKIKGKTNQVKIECVPPEEILVTQDARSIDPRELPFFEHRSYKTISDLREMGYDVEDTLSDDDDLMYAPEWQSRNEFGEEWERGDQDNDANRKVVYREIYYTVDADGDGIAERRMICAVGRKILANEVTDDTPFAAITPFLMPHKHYGRALADLVKDVQVIKTTVMRNILDNFYHANNARYAVSDRVNLDDMLVSRPGGIVRTDGEPGTAILPLQVQAIGPSAFPLMEYLDSIKEERTGVTKYTQGMDANSLNKTASGISQIFQASQARIELIGRTFAETGVKQLFLGIHKLLLQHSKKEQVVRLRGKWVAVDPRQWKTRTDMTVTVGLGTGNKDMQLMHLQSILAVQKEAMMGKLPIVTPQNIYAACVELTKNAGFKDADKFWTDPSSAPPQPPEPNPEQIKVQGQMQIEQAKLQADAQKFQAQTQIEAQKAQQQLQQEQLRSQNDVAIEKEKIAAQMELERWKAQLDAEVELQKEQMRVASQQAMKEMEVTASPVQVNAFDKESHAGMMEALKQMLEQQQQSTQALIETLSRPKQIVRGPDGRAVGVQ